MFQNQPQGEMMQTTGQQITQAEIRVEAERLAEAERLSFCPDDGQGAPDESYIGEDTPDDGPFPVKINPQYILRSLGRNQIGDAELYRALHRGIYIYDHSAGQWYFWKGHYWAPDKVESAIAAVQKVSRLYGIELERISWRANSALSRGEAPDKKAELLEKALRRRLNELQSRSRVMDVLTLARAGDAGLSTAGDAWDLEPMLLACQNGVINLTDGTCRAGSPQDMIKTVCPVTWRGLNEPAPVWERFLMEIFDGNKELVRFMQRLSGYCLTGLTNEERYPFLIGKGRNGKTKFIEALKACMGDYAGTLSIETIMEQRNDSTPGGARADLMSLQGKRLMTSSESEDGRKLNVGKTKSLTGGDGISARSPYGRYQVDFQPTHKLILLTNFEPKVPPDDFALWERVLKIPFNMCFVDEPTAPNERKKDEFIKEKLQTEYSGILAWAMRGCLEWQKIGLQPPDIVRAATDSYRAKNDSLTDFIKACCQLTGEIQAKILFDAYNEYCQELGTKPLTINKFTEQMITKFDRYASKRKQFYIGISLFNE